MRIEEHPVLGTFEKGSRVQFSFDGKTIEGFEGEPIAIALRSNGVLIHRYTFVQQTAFAMADSEFF